VAAPVHRPKKQTRENVFDQQKHSANTTSVRNYNTVIENDGRGRADNNGGGRGENDGRGPGK
jgi:hypothetical protein